MLALASAAYAQTPTPEPTPPQGLFQDDLDFQGRSSVVQGSGARALGMGGAFLARADDATAASWNPAGLSYLRTLEITAVGTRNDFDTVKTNLGGVVVDEFLGYSPDLLAVAVPFESGRISGAAQVSFQRTFSQFAGNRTREGGDDPPFRLEGSGGFDVLALGTGVQVSRSWRFGMTLNRWINGFEQERERLQRRRSQQTVDFDFSGWNLNFGAMWTPVEALNVGLVAKTPFTGKVRMTRERFDFDSETGATTHNYYASDDVRLDFPGAVGFGLSWRPQSTLTLSADYTRTFWSNGEIRNYFILPQANEDGSLNPPEPPDEVFDVLPYPSLFGAQVDTEQVRLGAEYVLIRGDIKWPLRAGLFTDRQYFLDVAGQVPRFLGFTLGTGLIAGPVLFDVAYVREWGDYVNEDGAGVDVDIDRFFVSVIYRSR